MFLVVNTIKRLLNNSLEDIYGGDLNDLIFQTKQNKTEQIKQSWDVWSNASFSFLNVMKKPLESDRLQFRTALPPTICVTLNKSLHLFELCF